MSTSPNSSPLVTPLSGTGRAQRARRAPVHYAKMVDSDEIEHSEGEDEQMPEEEEDESYGKNAKGVKDDSDDEKEGEDEEEVEEEDDEKAKKKKRKMTKDKAPKAPSSKAKTLRKTPAQKKETTALPATMAASKKIELPAKKPMTIGAKKDNEKAGVSKKSGNATVAEQGEDETIFELGDPVEDGVSMEQTDKEGNPPPKQPDSVLARPQGKNLLTPKPKTKIDLAKKDGSKIFLNPATTTQGAKKSSFTPLVPKGVKVELKKNGKSYESQVPSGSDTTKSESSRPEQSGKRSKEMEAKDVSSAPVTHPKDDQSQHDVDSDHSEPKEDAVLRNEPESDVEEREAVEETMDMPVREPEEETQTQKPNTKGTNLPSVAPKRSKKQPYSPRKVVEVEIVTPTKRSRVKRPIPPVKEDSERSLGEEPFEEKLEESVEPQSEDAVSLIEDTSAKLALELPSSQAVFDGEALESLHASRAKSEAGGQNVVRMMEGEVAEQEEEKWESLQSQDTQAIASQGSNAVSQSSKRKRSNDSTAGSKKPAPAVKVTAAGRSAILAALIAPDYVKHIDFTSVKSTEDTKQLARHWREVLSRKLAVAWGTSSSQKVGSANGKITGETRKQIWKAVCDAYEKADWTGVLAKYQDDDPAGAELMTTTKLKRHLRDSMKKEGDNLCMK